jgi:hypothetical protein
MAKNGGLIVVVALLLVFWNIIDLNQSEASQSASTQCNDGIDNDGDGSNDSSDGNCLWGTDATPPTVPTFYYCPDHNDESTSPSFSSEEEAINSGCEQV